MPSASPDLAREVMQTALTDAERNLLRVASSSVSRAVGLYGRQLGGESGVRSELARIREKVESSLAARVERAERVESSDLRQQAADIAGVARQDVEPEPVRRALSVPVVSMNGAAAATPVDDGPPVTAAASSSEPRVAAERSSPRPRRPPAVQDGLRERVLELLRADRMTSKRAAKELGDADRNMKERFSRMAHSGVIVRTEDNAFDWLEAGVTPHGRPGRVWRLAEEPEGVRSAVRLARPTPVGRRPHKGPLLYPPRELDPVPELPSPNGDGPPVREPDAFECEPFNAREVWRAFSVEERRELMLVMVGSLMFKETVRTLLDLDELPAEGG